MKVLQILLLFLTIRADGQQANRQQANNQQARLDSITQYLDSAAVAEQCFKLIPNREDTKCLAFYVVEMFTPSYEKIQRGFGGSYQETMPNDTTGLKPYFAYVVKGVRDLDQWYYVLNNYYEFYASDITVARNTFLKGRRKEKFDALAAEAIRDKAARASRKSDWAADRMACAWFNKIWTHLHGMDSAQYDHPWINPENASPCLVLYNETRTLFLIPIIYYDAQSAMHLNYFVLKQGALYKWKPFPDRTFTRPKGNEGLEIVYDIRKYIKNWGWGTSNTISEDDFWKNQVRDEDLAPFSM